MPKNKWIIALTFWLAMCSTLRAQAPQPKAQKATPATPTSPMYWSVNTMMEGYIQQMTRYYNLTPEQQEYTRDLMGQRVKRFLSLNETDVRWLAAEMFDYQLKRELPPPEIAKEWAYRARPLVAAIRREVLDGNAKWREILSDQQKQQHDNDLKLMKKEFDNLEQRVDRWSKGDVAPGDFPGVIGNQPRTVRKSEDAWQYYVRNFIQVYNLDEGQRQTANSILRQLRDEATRYREAHKDEFAKLDADDAETAKSEPKTDPEELKRSQEQTKQRTEKRRDLEKPIVELFNRLKTELIKIPTVEQVRARDLQLDNMEAMARGRYRDRRARAPSVGTRPASPATAPAATRPAQNS